jgi:hypothetical protein
LDLDTGTLKGLEAAAGDHSTTRSARGGFIGRCFIRYACVRAAKSVGLHPTPSAVAGQSCAEIGASHALWLHLSSIGGGLAISGLSYICTARREGFGL